MRLAPCSSFSYAPSTSSGITFTCAMHNNKHLRRAQVQAKFQIFWIKRTNRVCTLTCSFSKEHFTRVLHFVENEESSTLSLPQLITVSDLKQCESDKTPAYKIEERILHDCHQDKTNSAACSAEVVVAICDREIQRRQKIGLANKGRTPWNKGRKHTTETRERIKKRTIEALSDPKVMSSFISFLFQVKRKMSEWTRSHSDVSKARMSASLKRKWEERLKQRRSQEKCYLIWARCISEAAKKGNHDQQELDWGSYEKMKADIMSQHLQQKAEKARAKEIAKMKAEEATKIRAEKRIMLAEQRKEKEKAAIGRKLKALEKKKALSKVLARLTKSQSRRKQLNNLTSIQKEMVTEPQPILENWDIEHIKIEKMRREVSLADQIRAVKSRKADLAADRVLKTAPLDPLEGR